VLDADDHVMALEVPAHPLSVAIEQDKENHGFSDMEADECGSDDGDFLSPVKPDNVVILGGRSIPWHVNSTNWRSGPLDPHQFQARR
jgi:hypothetical protein